MRTGYKDNTKKKLFERNEVRLRFDYSKTEIEREGRERKGKREIESETIIY